MVVSSSRCMAEQYLNGAQVGAGFEQVRGISCGVRHPRTTHDLHSTKICYRCHPFYGVEVEVVRHLRRTESTVLIVRLPDRHTDRVTRVDVESRKLCDRLS